MAMISSSPVRRPRLYLALCLLTLSALIMAQTSRPEPDASRPPTVWFEGHEIPVPINVAGGSSTVPVLPMVALAPLAERLGGTLAVDHAGENATLKLEGKDIVLGVGSTIVTVGDEIVSLPQPVTRNAAGLFVPVDFLRKTYGTLLGYGFDWRPGEGRLVIGPRSAREIPVLLDVVQLQGVTTVALQFPEIPRYSIDQEPGVITISMISDRIAAPPARRLPAESLVEGIDFGPQQVRLRFVDTDIKAESYTLDNPFRLVFDVHRPSSSALVAPVAPGPPVPRIGIRTIVLDPGHGGVATGAVGASGVTEKDLTLLIAHELRGNLERRLGVRTVLTRDDDTDIPHDRRTALANQNKADLFVSIHLNSALGAGAHGAETYFLSNRATDSRAARAAAMENLDQQVGLGTDAPQELELILWDLAQSYHMAESQRLAAIIQEELNATLQLRNRGVKQAPFRVLVGAAMPAVLVELGFISNPDEEAKLQTPAYRTQLVDALVRAIGRYKDLAEGRPPAPVQPAATGAPGAPSSATPGGAPPAATPPAPPAPPAATPPAPKPPPKGPGAP